MARPPITARVDSTGMYTFTRVLEKEIGVELAEGMDRLGKIGEEEMRRIITNTESHFSDTKTQYGIGPAGRIRTGAMLRSVGSRLRGGVKELWVEVGYLSEYQDYFGYQDGGFMNVWKLVGFNPMLGQPTAPNAPDGFLFDRVPGRKTAGIFAVRGARQEMLDKRDIILRQVGIRIMNKMKKRNII